MALDEAEALLQGLPGLLAALPGSQAEAQLLLQHASELSKVCLHITMEEPESVQQAGAISDRQRLTRCAASAAARAAVPAHRWFHATAHPPSPSHSAPCLRPRAS